MGNNIQKYNYSVENKFSEKSFLKDLLVACYEKKLLDNNILARIYYERMELLRVKLKYYTKDESSSVMIEVAESILKCIDYTIGIYLKNVDNIELIIEELKHTSLSDMLKMGQDLIKNKKLECKKLFNEIKANKLKVDNYSYNDTVDDGLSPFFKEYDDFFAPHETPCSIDYQLYIDNMNFIGVEYMYNYLYDLSLENEFCNKFNIGEINKLLKGYDKKCELLLINIFELVFINSLGLIICNKDLNSLNINNLDREIIKNKLEKLTIEELKDELIKDAKICLEVLEIKNTELMTYIKKGILNIALLINERIKLNKLETVFISFNEGEGNEMVEYIDGIRMANSEFKKLTEEIRECSLVEDKILLIKDNIKSLEDLVDMLNAECLFGDEYITFLRSLSKMEIVLLSKYISDLSFEYEYERDSYVQFNKYILSLSKEEQREISELKERINL
ncbi:MULTISPECIES: DUF6179 domain-containing protein [Clostridium]|uniref:Uncharacterized protein n=2 Tax=Clostridium TaxID=1485 RepID=A0A7X5SXB9_CLOSG|nr:MULTISPECIES: DUF6179 domain-containing protein [Clostridium]AJD29826.1 hypothetical protein T258_3255 [Clostridium botulinum Prevot_594]AVP61416.1 hypothetical protein C7M79_12205 [Clostridium botulinum]AKC61413.1 hypothetical protein CLSPO_c06910 [Clostridium sporogenes]AKJ88748.1 hypothetical protein CLSPOx_03465 [Clostridium sporogenes]AVP64782.1 hypothetical protein C3B64_11125 [Clostridium botulinum]